MASQREEVAGVDQAVELVDQAGGEAAVGDEGAGLDVAGLGAVGEVGGADQGVLTVDDDALGVQ